MKVCNVCGKKFDVYDVANGFCLHKKIGYGSEYDGADLNLDVCSGCFDKFIPILKKYCKHNPVQEV